MLCAEACPLLVIGWKLAGVPTEDAALLAKLGDNMAYRPSAIAALDLTISFHGASS